MTDKEQRVVSSSNGDHGLPEQLAAYDGFPAAGDQPADFASTAAGDQPADFASLVSVGFLTAAIRRSAWFCCIMAVVGFLIGCGYYVTSPPAYQASASIFLTDGPYENPLTAATDDQALAQSRTVAGLAVHKLGLQQSVDSFLGAYKVTVVTNRVLLVTFTAPTAKQAVRGATAAATAFLQLRASELENAQATELGSLEYQANQASQRTNAINTQISQLSAQPASPAQRATLSSLRAELSQETIRLGALETEINGIQSSNQAATASAVKGSVVLDAAAPLPHSRLKPLLLDVALGLLLGLVLGMGIVVVRALISDRLRRRDDVARALGAPVKVSVGTLRLHRWLPGRRGLEAARGAEVQRIVTHLRGSVPASSGGVAALSVVPVDDPQVAALALVSLAMSCTQQGKQVVVADLCRDAPAAMLLDSRKPGVRQVRVHGADLVVAVPDRDDLLPVGPLEPTSPHAQRSSFTEAVAAASGSADLLLALATLDPSLRGEHLATWATAAVAVVTAGKSSATRIHAVGEMIRLAGVRLDSAVLTGADKTDESLGTTYLPGNEYQPDRV